MSMTINDVKQFDYIIENPDDTIQNSIVLDALIKDNNDVAICRFITERANNVKFQRAIDMRDKIYVKLQELNADIDVAKGYVENKEGKKRKVFVDIRETTRVYREFNEYLAILNKHIAQYRALTARAAYEASVIRDNKDKEAGVFISYDDDTIGDLVAIGEYESGSEEWHNVRLNGIGGSDVAKIMKTDTFYGVRDYREVLMKKVGLHTDNASDDFRDDLTTAIGRGNAWEEYVRQLFQDKHPEYRVAFCKTSWEGKGDYSYRHANFDGLIVDNFNKAEGIIEIKTGVHMSKWGDVEEGIFAAPANYRQQVLWYALNAKLEYGYIVAVLDDYDYREYYFDMNDPKVIAECEKIIASTDDFWTTVQGHKHDLANGINTLVNLRSGFMKNFDLMRLAEALSLYTGESFEESNAKIRVAFDLDNVSRSSITQDIIQKTMIKLYADHDPNLRDRPLIGIDLETNHTSVKSGRIIETGIVVSNPDGSFEEAFSKLHKLSDVSFEAFGVGAEEVHHISAEMLDNEADSVYENAEIQEEILGLLKRGGIIVAHNASFEDSFLTVNLDGYAELRDSGDIKLLDTKNLTSTVIVDSPNNSLESFANANGIAYENAHRAMEDTKMMMIALRNFQTNIHENGEFVYQG